MVVSKRNRISSKTTAVSLLIPSSSVAVAKFTPLDDNRGVIT
jgi:hypothetical protein